jgi:hypothetical protein
MHKIIVTSNWWNRLLSITLFLFLSYLASAQYEIRGQVVAGDDQTPLPGASVFFANTTKGSSTNVDGEFVFYNLPPGRLQLVVSFVGYETLILELKTPLTRKLKIILKPSARQLKSITIYDKKQKYSDWLDYLKIFKENFIGQSGNAKLCELVNPKILSFDNDKDQLTATADTSLIIMNRALGYRLKFLLDIFSLTYLTHTIRYQAQFVFSSLAPTDEVERKYWATNRLHAYYGSEMHFMRALYKRKLMEEGFFVSLNKEGYDKKGRKINEAFADTVIFIESPVFPNKKMRVPIVYYNKILDSVQSTPTQPILSFQGNLEITYVNERESLEYQRIRNSTQVGFKQFQRSQIFLLKPGFIVEPNGQIYMEDILSKVYWSWELVADSLPFDYDPEEDLKLFSETEIKSLFKTSEIINYSNYEKSVKVN